jgi:hypothetical protein
MKKKVHTKKEINTNNTSVKKKKKSLLRERERERSYKKRIDKNINKMFGSLGGE